MQIRCQELPSSTPSLLRVSRLSVFWIMVESMDEEELGGLSAGINIGGGGSAFVPVERGTFVQDVSSRVPAPNPHHIWVRKRRLGEQATMWKGVCQTGGGRESPDSDQSASSGSDVAINQGIKRMRLNHSASSGLLETSLSSPTSPAAAIQTLAGNHGLGLSRFPAESMPGTCEAGIVRGSSQHRLSPSLLSEPPSATVQLGHDPSGRQAPPPIGHSGLGAEEPRQSLVRAEGGGTLSQQPASFHCPSFPAERVPPPGQARYVRGIRVQANAPADVDYSSTNVTLRRLHMERRLGGGGGGRGSWEDGGRRC
ncbi:unnamed protein product [Choristocarpus tenellus]